MKRTLRIAGIPLIAVAVGAGVWAQTPSMSIAGRVLSAGTGRPIPGAQATMSVADYGLGGAANADGTFEIAAREAGRYRVGASAPGYLSRGFGEEPEIGSTLVALQAGQRVPNINIELHRGGTIAGAVIADGKEPLVSAVIRAFAKRIRYGHARFEPAGDAKTDDRGNYRLTGLRPGQYAVGAIDHGVATFAPSTANPSVASLVAITSDTERAGVNLVVNSSRTGSIEGTLSGTGAGAPRLTVELVQDPLVTLLPPITARPEPGGRFVFTDVPSGRYHVIVRPGANSDEPHAWGIAPVLVAAGATGRATLKLSTGSQISGVVDAAGVRQLTITLTSIGTNHPEATSRSLRMPAHGSFVIPSVPPGQYKIEAVLGQGDFLPESRIARVIEPATHRLLASIFVKGVDVSDRVLVVSANASIEGVRVVVAATAARITGTVRDASGKPVTAGAVVVAPVDPREWTVVSRRIRVTRADTDGVFHVPTLPAGRYLVAHVDQLKPGQLWDPAFLKTLARSAQVTVAEGQIATVELRLK